MAQSCRLDYKWGHRSDGQGYLAYIQKIAGSNPAVPTLACNAKTYEEVYS